MLHMSQAGVPAWSAIEARGTVEPPHYFMCILRPKSIKLFDRAFLRLDDFLGDVLAGGNLRIHQGCMWGEVGGGRAYRGARFAWPAERTAERRTRVWSTWPGRGTVSTSVERASWRILNQQKLAILAKASRRAQG